MDNIYFYLPGMAETFELNCILLARMYYEPDHFYPGVRIGAIFGAFPGCMWNGGRYLAGTVEEAIMDKAVEYFNKAGIPVRWTWTNPMLNEEDLKDKLCNRLTKKHENGLNEILVNNDLTETYFREAFPMYPLISSTTKRITNIEALNNELSKDYKLVVVDYDFNNDWELLNQIQQPQKCELLINPICNPRCPYRKRHYEIIGSMQKNDYTNRDSVVEDCMAQGRFIHEVKKLPTFISVDDLYNKYVPAGFRHFKIEGRGTCPLKPMEWYLYYLVKPEYQEEERSWLQSGIEGTWLNPNIPIYIEEPNIS